MDSFHYFINQRNWRNWTKYSVPSKCQEYAIYIYISKQEKINDMFKEEPCHATRDNVDWNLYAKAQNNNSVKTILKTKEVYLYKLDFNNLNFWLLTTN